MEPSWADYARINECLAPGVSTEMLVGELRDGLMAAMTGFMSPEQFTVWWAAHDWLNVNTFLCLRALIFPGV